MSLKFHIIYLVVLYSCSHYFHQYNLMFKELQRKRLMNIVIQGSQTSNPTPVAAASGINRLTNPRTDLNPSSIILPSDKFGETEVKELVSLGFTRDQTISELRRFDGDKTQATAALFAKSLRF